MAKKRVEYTPERDYVYTEKTTAPAWGTYRTPTERAAAQAASLKAANSPAGTGWDAYRTPEERAAMMRAANNADKTVESSEPLNPHPLGAVDPIYQNNPAVRAAAQEAVSNKPMVSEDIMNEILNRKQFSYNPNADALYQQYKDQYLTAGQTAMKDTMGKAAALTGGYGNTYMQTVGQQVYDDYAARAADKIPELEQLAYERWAREGDELRSNYDLLYGREKDAEEAAWRQKEWDFKQDQWKHTLEMDDFQIQQTLREFEENKAQFWATHDLNERKFVLDEWATKKGIELDERQLEMAADQQSFSQALDLMNFYETKRQNDRNYALNEKSTNADIDLGYRNLALNEKELNARINNSYYSGGSGESGGGGNGKTTTTDEDPEPEPQTMSDKEVTEAAKSLLKEYKSSRESEWSQTQFWDKVYKKYKENAPYIMLALEKLRKGNAQTDKNITNRNPVIAQYTD